ncbi:hypothetical protein GE09DRAFT_1006964 [Coniochaeta sp. 2T2.1]|nr:hypothetical protein GE09DRAFT_1006964 [Coniochaeta sp. 2T2.1]
MATETGSPQREPTPTAPSLAANPTAPNSLPQKRVLEDDHSPAVSSPLNPDIKPQSKVQIQPPDESQIMGREKRTKKESLKKRESKVPASGVASSRAGTPDAKQGPEPTPAETSPMRYKLASPKLSDFEPARGPIFVPHHEISSGADGSKIEFCETTEHVYNKKNFHYTHCIADPAFPSSFYYRQTEPEPYGPHMSFEDTATHIFFDKTGRHVSTDKGFRMSRANVAVREGRYYWECRITRGIPKTKGPENSEALPHVRVGWARREAVVDAPVGFDAYSYGIRDVAGQKVHMSRPKDFSPPGEDLREGDVIGLEIQLPSEILHRKIVQGKYNPAVDLLDEGHHTSAEEAPNIVRDRIPIRFKAHIYFEKIDYHTAKELDDLMNPSPMGSSGPVGSAEPPNPTHRFPNLRTLPNSHIKIYKNGVEMGTPFTNLLAFLPPASKPSPQPGAREGLDDGMLGYYPAVSVFRGGAAEVNFGPDFWYPPPGYEGGNTKGDVEMRDADQPAPQQKKVQFGGEPPVKSVDERYNDQIVEDIVYDIIDEVGFWMQDGGEVVDRVAEKAGDLGDSATGLVVAGGREEIKELVQDD